MKTFFKIGVPLTFLGNILFFYLFGGKILFIEWLPKGEITFKETNSWLTYFWVSLAIIIMFVSIRKECKEIAKNNNQEQNII